MILTFLCLFSAAQGHITPLIKNEKSQHELQGDIFIKVMSRFHASAENQCVPNSIAAVIYTSVVDPISWTSHGIDCILETGDTLYNCIYNNKDILFVTDIPNTLHILGHNHILKYYETLYRLMNCFAYDIEP